MAEVGMSILFVPANPFQPLAIPVNLAPRHFL